MVRSRRGFHRKFDEKTNSGPYLEFKLGLPLLGQVLDLKLPNLSKISKMKSKVVRAEKSDVVQWGEGHLFWVMVVLATIAVIALVYLLYKIRKKRLQNAPAADLDVKPKTLGLRKTWRNFKKALPSRYRASAKLFRSFYVFGASGSGKTTIIDESIHWRGQERQYRHSETRNPNLQIYHGATQFVFEFGGKVLEDTTAVSVKSSNDLKGPAACL